MNTGSLEYCIFDPSAKVGTGIFDFMRPAEDGSLVTLVRGLTLEALKASGQVSPEASVCPWEEAAALSRCRARQRLCQGPQRVTRERWLESFEVLFPARWEQAEDYEVFMVPECITDSIYCFGVRIDEDYFLINEEALTPAKVLVQQCKVSMEKPQ